MVENVSHFSLIRPRSRGFHFFSTWGWGWGYATYDVGQSQVAGSRVPYRGACLIVAPVGTRWPNFFLHPRQQLQF